MGFSIEIIAKDKKSQKKLNEILAREFKALPILLKREKKLYPQGVEFNDNPENPNGVGFYGKIWTRSDESFYVRSLIKMLAQTPLVKKLSLLALSKKEGWEDLSWLAQSPKEELSFYLYEGSFCPVVDKALAEFSPFPQVVVDEEGMASFESIKLDPFKRKDNLREKEYKLVKEEISRLKKIILSSLK